MPADPRTIEVRQGYVNATVEIAVGPMSYVFEDDVDVGPHETGIKHVRWVRRTISGIAWVKGGAGVAGYTLYHTATKRHHYFPLGNVRNIVYSCSPLDTPPTLG